MLASPPSNSRLCQGYPVTPSDRRRRAHWTNLLFAFVCDWHCQCRRPGASHRRPLRGPCRRRHGAPSRIGGVRPGDPDLHGLGRRRERLGRGRRVPVRMDEDGGRRRDRGGHRLRRRWEERPPQGDADDPAGARGRRRLCGRCRPRRWIDLYPVSRREEWSDPGSAVQSRGAGAGAESSARATTPDSTWPRPASRSASPAGPPASRSAEPSMSGSGSARTTRTKWSRRASATSWCRPSPRRRSRRSSTARSRPCRSAPGSTDRRVQYVSTTRFEAPNWYPDGKAWLVNSGGRLLKIPMGGGAVETVNTGTRTRNNNDHGISKDGSTIVISDQTEGATATGGGPSRIYTLPIAGGEPKLVTPNAPSVLARHLAGRRHAGLLRPAQQRVRCLHDSHRRRRGDAPDHRDRPRRRPRGTRPTASGSTSTRCGPG